MQMQAQTSRGAIVGILVALAAAVVVDHWLLPLQDVPVLYTIPSMLAARRLRPRAVLATAAAALALFLGNTLTSSAVASGGWPLGAAALLVVGYLAYLLAEQREETARRTAEVASGGAARERAEEARRASETRMQAIVDTAVDGIVVIDERGTVESFNRAAERIFGYGADEVIGQNVAMLMPTPYREEHDGYFARYHATGERRVIGIGREVAGRRKDGGTFPLDLAVSEMHLEGRRLYTGLVRDITARKQAEEALRVRASQQAAVALLGQEALAGHDLEPMLDDAAQLVAEVMNARFAAVFELLPDDRHLRARAGEGWAPGVIGRTLVREGPRCLLDVALRSSEPRTMADRGEDGGCTVPALLREQGVVGGIAVAIHGRERSYGVLAAFSDVPRTFDADDASFLQAVANVLAATVDRLRTERALRDSEDRYRATFQQAAIGIAHMDVDGRYLRVNEHLCRLLGYSRQELLERRLRDVLWAEDLAISQDQMTRMIAGGLERFEAEQRFVRKDGTLVWLRRTVSLVRNADGDPSYFISVMEDVTARRQGEEERARLLERERVARAEAEHAVRGRDEFLSVAAHELKTPVTSLRGFAQLAVRQLDATGRIEPSLARQALDVIDRQSDRLTSLVGRLLDISRIEAGRLVLEPRMSDVTALVGTVLSGARARTTRHEITLDAPGPIVARIDPTRLEQVVTNLVENAIKYSPDGGPVDVNVTERDGQVAIAVRDRGLGIPTEKRPHIFERYYQAHALSQGGGMGLGLFISRQIVDLHGGELRAEFPEDGGTRFVVSIPRDEEGVGRRAEGGDER